jgi:hypothetical protein
MKNSLKIDDSVKVKKGTMCPDLKDLCIGGWQGRISEITEDENGNMFVCIQLDSITLKNMPDYFVEQSGEEGLDFTTMFLGIEEVELTEPINTKEDASEVFKRIQKTHFWNWLGEEGKRIQRVLGGIDEEDMIGALKEWEKYFEKTLTFPFDAKVLEYEKGPLRSGDKVSVKKISLVDDHYGIIVELRQGRKKYDHPLNDLEVINRDPINYQPVKDYRVWFANR